MPKRKKKLLIAFDDSIDEVIDQLLEVEKQVYTNKLQSWELYCQKKRAFIHENSHQFRTSFLNGYHALMNEIKKTSR